MNYLVILIALLNLVVHLEAATYESKVSEVVIYKNKARETRYLTVHATDKGRQEWILTNISKNMDPASLQVAVSGATLVSVTTRVNYLAPNPLHQQIRLWQDSLEKCENHLNWVKEQLAVYQGEIRLLQEIIKVDGDETGLYAKTTEEMLNLYRDRSLKVREFIFDLMKKENEWQKLVNNLKQQIQQSGGSPTQAVQEIVLVAEVRQAGKIDIKCSYMVNGAGWTPTYNLRATGWQEPVQIEMLAEIRQHTGYDWENVSISLSTSDPSANQTRPEWIPLFIDFFKAFPSGESIKKMQGVAATQMAYAPRVTQSTDEQPLSEDEFVSVQPIESPTAQIYHLPGKSFIRTGSESYQLMISSMTAPARMIYYTIPSRDPTAYLIARIPGWEQYNLLQGRASIFFEETFTGHTVIYPKVANDTLALSLGRDDMIQIDRKAITDISSSRWLGNAKKEVKTFEITVRNNKKSDIQIEVLDQIPVSRQKDIEVTLESSDGADYNAENGRLKWLMALKPGELRKVRFSYSYKYPGHQQVILVH